MNIDDIMKKIGEGAAVAADVAGQAFTNTKKAVNKSVDVISLNAKISGLKTKINAEYTRIGKLVYQTHLDPNASPEDIDEILNGIDEMNEEIAEITAERDRRRSE